MIIECTNCHKKFKVDPSKIPNSGRNIQCGTCGHIWFYKHDTFSKKISRENKCLHCVIVECIEHKIFFTPNQSATLIIVPRFPGSLIESSAMIVLFEITEKFSLIFTSAKTLFGDF